MENIERLVSAILADMKKFNKVELGSMEDFELSSHLDGLATAFEIISEERVFYDIDHSVKDRLIYSGFSVTDGRVYSLDEPF